MRVEVGPQVIEFVCTLAPEPRRAIRRGLRGLEDERGDIKALKEELAGYFRLRIMAYRLIFYPATSVRSGERFIQCVFAEHRSKVYETFAEGVR